MQKIVSCMHRCDGNPIASSCGSAGHLQQTLALQCRGVLQRDVLSRGDAWGREPLACHTQNGSAEEPVRSLRAGFSFVNYSRTGIALRALP